MTLQLWLRSRYQAAPLVFSLTMIACGSKVGAPEASAGNGGAVSGAGGAIGGATQSENRGGSSGDGTATAECSSGDTRVCVGPAACEGGQSCGADQHWGACDCGVAGNTATGGSTASGGTGGAASGAGGATSSEEGGSVGDAGSAGQAALDEPCPSTPIGADCSGQCASKPAVCEAACPSKIVMSPLSDGLVVARLPSHPAAACQCNDSGTAAAAYSVALQTSEVPSEYFHLSVPEPWGITLGSVTGCASFNRVHCINNLTLFSVWTSDPNAPAINLTVESGLKCP
jgi:hypothetical protein